MFFADKVCGNQRHSEHLDTDMGSEDNGCGNQRNSEHVDTEWGSEDTEEECFFYETETYKTGYNMLQNQDILVFDGLSGTGKTFTAKHILHELKSRGFTPIKCQVPEDLTMCEEKSGKSILFVDDLFNCKSAERIQWLEKLDKFLNLLQKESCNESVCYKLIATVKTSLKEFMLERYSKHNFVHILEGNDGNHLVSFDVKLSKNEMKGILENTAKGLHCAVPNFSEEEWEHFEGCNFPFGFPLFAKLFMIPQKFSYEIFVSDPSAYLANEIKKAVENDKDMLPLFYLLTIQEFELTNRKRVQEIDLAHEDECTQLLSSYSSTLGEWSQNGTCLASKYVDYFFKFGKGESKFHFIHESVRDAVLKYLLTNFLKECVKEFPLDILCSEWDVCLSEKTHDVTISMQNIAERLISALMEKEDFYEISSFSIFTDKIFVDIFFQKLKDKKLYFLFTATDETNKCPLPYWFAFHGSTIILEKIIDIMTNEEGGMKGKESNTLFFILAGLCNSKCKHSIEWIENMLSNFCCEKILNICFHCFSKRYCDEHSYLLDLSCSNYNKDIVRFLLKRGAKFHKSTWNGWDFLRSAAAHRDDQFLLESFLQKVKKFKIENYNKNAKEKSPEEIIHEFHKEDSFLLDLATKCEPKIHLSKKTVQAVLSIAELNISDEPHNILSSCNDRNETILHVIVKSANNNGSTIEDAAELLEYLKNQNACQDVFDIDDNTPLMIELSKPDPNFKIIERLLSCTQNVNLSDIENRNLLHTFLMKPRTTKNDRLILELLIEKGVYSKHQDQNKKMPHDYALKNKCSTPIKCYLNRN